MYSATSTSTGRSGWVIRCSSRNGFLEQRRRDDRDPVGVRGRGVGERQLVVAGVEGVVGRPALVDLHPLLDLPAAGADLADEQQDQPDVQGPDAGPLPGQLEPQGVGGEQVDQHDEPEQPPAEERERPRTPSSPAGSRRTPARTGRGAGSRPRRTRTRSTCPRPSRCRCSSGPGCRRRPAGSTGRTGRPSVAARPAAAGRRRRGGRPPCGRGRAPGRRRGWGRPW